MVEYPGIEPGVSKTADLQSTASPLMLLLHKSLPFSCQVLLAVRLYSAALAFRFISAVLGRVLLKGIIKHTSVTESVSALAGSHCPRNLHLICFRIPCIATGYDRDSTLPRSLTNRLSPGFYVSCPPVCQMFIVPSEDLVSSLHTYSGLSNIVHEKIVPVLNITSIHLSAWGVLRPPCRFLCFRQFC